MVVAPVDSAPAVIPAAVPPRVIVEGPRLPPPVVAKVATDKIVTDTFAADKSPTDKSPTDKSATLPTPAPGLAPAPKIAPLLRVAVYDLELQDIAPAVGVVVSSSLLEEMRKLDGVSVVGMNEIRDMLSLEATKQLAGCSEAADSCLAELAGAIGVDELVSGKLTKVDDGTAILLRRIDQKHSAVKGTFSERLKASSGQEFLATIGPAVAQLYASYPLRAGATRGVAKEVARRLDPPPLPKWLDITLGGVTVATAATGATFGVLALGSQNDFHAAVVRATPTTSDPAPAPASGTALKSYQSTGQQRAVIADGLLIGAGGLAVVTIVVALRQRYASTVRRWHRAHRSWRRSGAQ